MIKCRLPSLMKILVAIFALSPGPTLAQPNERPDTLFEKARFIVDPAIFLHHPPERSFIGPGMFRLENGDILMAAPWGRPPTHFEQLAAKFPVPMLYRSQDGGRT